MSNIKNASATSLENLIHMLDSESDVKNIVESDPDLLCFNNGIYNGKNGQFIQCRPSDYDCITVGSDFVELKEDDPLVTELSGIFTQNLSENERNDIIMGMMSFLEPRNKKEILTELWTGGGHNGKTM